MNQMGNRGKGCSVFEFLDGLSQTEVSKECLTQNSASAMSPSLHLGVLAT